MPQITLSRADVLKLHAFCTEHKLKEFFLAKDDGAYVGASMGEKGNCIFYFRGCNPNTDGDYCYEHTRNLFGGDDFGEHLPLAWLQKVVDTPVIQRMTIKVTARQLTAEFSR